MKPPNRIIKKAKLIEVSIVSLPANPDALITARQFQTGAIMPDANPNPTPAANPNPAPEPEKKAAPPPPDPNTLTPLAGPMVVTKMRGYNVLRALGMAIGDPSRGDDGLERELHLEMARARKSTKGVLIPISALLPLTRKTSAGQDTISTTPSLGGVLAATDRLMTELLVDTGDAIRMNTILGRLGASVVAIPSDQKIRIPRKTKPGVAAFVQRDGSAAVSDLEWDDLSSTPFTLATAAQLNRSSLIYASLQMQQLVTADLGITVVDAINQQFLWADGSSNTPKGVIKQLGDASKTYHGELDATPTLMKILTFTEHVESYAETPDASRKWLLHDNTANTYATTPKWSGSIEAIMQPGGELGGFPVVESHRANKSTTADVTPVAVFGDWSSAFFFQYGPGIDWLPNVYADSVYLSGGMLLRGLLDVDFLVRDPGRFAYADDAIGAVDNTPGP